MVVSYEHKILLLSGGALPQSRMGSNSGTRMAARFEPLSFQMESGPHLPLFTLLLILSKNKIVRNVNKRWGVSNGLVLSQQDLYAVAGIR